MVLSQEEKAAMIQKQKELDQYEEEMVRRYAQN